MLNYYILYPYEVLLPNNNCVIQMKMHEFKPTIYFKGGNILFPREVTLCS